MDTKTLIAQLAERTNRDPEDIGVVLQTFGSLLAECVKDGDSVAIPGFGSFEPKMRAERITTHPASGKRILVPPKLSMIFKPSALLKQKVRN